MSPYLFPLATPSLPPSISHPSRWSQSITQGNQLCAQYQFLIGNTSFHPVLVDGMKIIYACVPLCQMNQFPISMNLFTNATFLEKENLPRSRKVSLQSRNYFYDPRMSTKDTRVIHSTKIAKKTLF